MSAMRSGSRAVVRYIEAGTSAQCAGCELPVQFRARIKAQQVICNVYVGDRWDRVEHWHRNCYNEADAPYGKADDSQPQRPKARPAA